MALSKSVASELLEAFRAGEAWIWPVSRSHRRTRDIPLDDVSDLNDRRQVAGGQLVSDGFHASVWQPGQMAAL
jgi:hypothetical protein